MNSATDFRVDPALPGAIQQDHIERFRAMGSTVTVQLPAATPDPSALARQVRSVFAEVERTCTRFDPGSDLMRANRTRTWTTVSSPCRQAVEEAYHAYRETGGLFDPRILAALKQIGYDRSFAYGAAPEVTPQPQGDPAAVAPFGHPWLPEFDEARSEIAIGEIPIDLGGIGKGLALRWAAARLAGCCPWFLIEAGGDCSLGGRSPTGGGWSVGVEDPEGGQTPAAVLAITDAACATTSTRLRRWRAGSVQVHHILDPRTGWPAESGLLSVTVVDADPATAEVWSKSLLIAGPDHIASLASSKELAALWIDERGRIEASPQMTEFIRWQR